MAEKIYKLKFDGEIKECIARTNAETGETTFYAKDHRFVVSPKGMDLDEFVKTHNEANAKKPVKPTQEQIEADEALAKWLKKEEEEEEE